MIPLATKLGELIAADGSRPDLRNALIVQDGYSYSLQSYPTKSRDAHETTSCLRTLLLPFDKPGSIFTDNSKEFIKACQEEQRTHHTSTPFMVHKPTGSQKELFDEWTAMVRSGLRQDWWDCATARQQMRTHSRGNLAVTNTSCPKTSHGCISSVKMNGLFITCGERVVR